MFLETTFQCPPLKFIVSQMFRIYLIILNIEKQLGNAVKRRQTFNQRFLKAFFLNPG